MKWFNDWVQARDNAREMVEETTEEETVEREEEEDGEEDLGPVETDKKDEKPSLEFGKLRKGGEKSLLGFCEVRQKGTVEACEWRVMSLKPKQKSPAFKIRF